ncbi:hypothetical protein D3C72_1558000 [compost metagenome]
MIAAPDEGHADAEFFCDFHGGAHRLHASERTDRVATIDLYQRRRGAFDGNGGACRDTAGLESFAIGFNARQSMGAEPEEVCKYQDVNDIDGVPFGQAQALERAHSELAEFGFGYSDSILLHAGYSRKT